MLCFSKLHCIAEIRAYWVETKPFEIDNPRHHYQIAAFIFVHVVERFSKGFSEMRACVEKSRVSDSD